MAITTSRFRRSRSFIAANIFAISMLLFAAYKIASLFAAMQ